MAEQTISTDLSISPDEIRDALKDFVKAYEPGTSAKNEVGYVTDASDGIAHVEGLPGVMANELVRFSDGTLGLAQNLEESQIGVVVLGEFTGIEEGQEVTRTGEVLSVPVGEGYLGRVVDPLGNPLDGLGEVATDGRRALELQAPGVMQRKSVHEPMQTGIKAIDAMIPIGRGQRQLIIGDRQTGKTAIALDTIINQKANWESGDTNKQVRCIYVAIGQKGSTIAGIKSALEEAGAMEYTTIVASPASDPAGFKYLAPYTGSAIGQHWMYAGKHVLIVFDDLSKQAEAYRAVSLLLRRPPGREAYPGDVFYLHSRLLERCAKLSDELGAGSMTGLPIIETKANDVSAYIPTNVISITDGQIFLQSDLFNANQRPAVDVGISVSRVGGDAQVKSIKSVSGTLKLDLAQYRSLEAFALFASDLDQTSRRQLARGARLTELLRQPQYSPYPVEEQVVAIWSGINGKLDEVPVEDVLRFERELLDFLGRNSTVLATIRDSNLLDKDSIAELETQVDKFKLEFQTGEGKPLASAGTEQFNQIDAEDITQEQIVVRKKRK
jgi:F-type H+-transporting ATPase subunit alpha